MIVCEVPGLNASHAPIFDCMLLWRVRHHWLMFASVAAAYAWRRAEIFYDLLLATFDWHVFSSS